MTDVRRMMRPNRRRFLFGSAGGIASYALGLSPSLAQPLHSTARIMVGFPAGGPSDVLARLLAEQMKRMHLRLSSRTVLVRAVAS
jgi:tripartite-type tricarboxylate transporter receptor subunit TctC